MTDGKRIASRLGLPGQAGEGAPSLRFCIPLRHYLLISAGSVSAALAIAVAISFVAVAYAASPVAPPRVAEVSSAVGAQVSFAFGEVIDSRHEIPPPEPQRSPLSQSVLGRKTDYVVQGRITNVNITFYDCAGQGFCGNMANGRRVYEGAAACSWNLATGTKFLIVGDPTGRVYVCEDRGLLTNTWVDVFFYYPSDGWRWQSFVGRYGTIEIVN